MISKSILTIYYRIPAGRLRHHLLSWIPADLADMCDETPDPEAAAKRWIEQYARDAELVEVHVQDGNPILTDQTCGYDNLVSAYHLINASARIDTTEGHSLLRQPDGSWLAFAKTNDTPGAIGGTPIREPHGSPHMYKFNSAMDAYSEAENLARLAREEREMRDGH